MLSARTGTALSTGTAVSTGTAASTGTAISTGTSSGISTRASMRHWPRCWLPGWAGWLMFGAGLPWPPLLLFTLFGLLQPVILHWRGRVLARVAAPRRMPPSALGRWLPLAGHAQVFLGFGGPWHAGHSQALQAHDGPAGGLRVGPAHQRSPLPVYWPQAALSRNVMALGSPGSGKSSLCVLLAWQAQRRGEAVVVLDPKGSRNLHATLLAGARTARQPFLALLPGQPERSAAYNPLAGCSTSAEVATRLCSLIEGPEGDPFRQFCWGALAVIAGALQVRHRPVTLSALRDAFSDAGEGLLHSGPAGTGPAEVALQALVAHDRVHYRKMTAPLLPVLALLCTGPLGELLSGTVHARPVLSLDALRTQRLTLYVGLDTLGNPALGRALALLLLQDLAAEAARCTALGAHPAPLQLMVDEAAELACPALLQLLGKGREAGVSVLIAVQTLADLEWRLGSAAAARVAEGNATAWFLFRQLDAISRRESESRLGLRCGERPSHSEGVVDTQAGLAGRRAQSRSDSVTREWVPRIPEASFMALADLECLAQMPDGTLLHLRLPCPVVD